SGVRNPQFEISGDIGTYDTVAAIAESAGALRQHEAALFFRTCRCGSDFSLCRSNETDFPKLYASHCEEGLIPITLGLPPIPELFVDERRFFDISCLIKSTTALTRDGSVKQFLCTRLVSVLMKYPK